MPTNFPQKPKKIHARIPQKNEKLQLFWIHAFSLNFSSWPAECWSDNPSGTFSHVRSCSARSLGIAKAWWFFHICFSSRAPRTVRMQFRQTCWKVLQIIWKIFHMSSQKFEKNSRFIEPKPNFPKNVPRDTKNCWFAFPAKNFPPETRQFSWPKSSKKTQC